MKKFLFLAIALAVTAAHAEPLEVGAGTVSNGGSMGAEVTVKTVLRGYTVGGIVGGVSDRKYLGLQYTSREYAGFARFGLGLAYTRADYSTETQGVAPCLICANPPPTVAHGTSSKVSPFVQLEAFRKLKNGAEIFAQTRYFTNFANGESNSKGRFFTGVGVRFSFN